MSALTLPGLEVPTWYVTNKGDPALLALADRHYSRVKRGTNQTGGPGHTLCLITPCQRAGWITKYNVGAGNYDGFDAFRCSLFRNEGAGLSSDLILAAMKLTEERWLARPRDGWITHVDPSKVESLNPGYCFSKAGWRKAGYTRERRLLLMRRSFVTQGRETA